MEVAVIGAVTRVLLPKLIGGLLTQKRVHSDIKSLLVNLRYMEAVLRDIEAAAPGQLDDNMKLHYDEVIRLTYSIKQWVSKFMAPGLWGAATRTMIKVLPVKLAIGGDLRSEITYFKKEIMLLREWFHHHRDSILAPTGHLWEAMDADIPDGLHVQVKDDIVKKLRGDGQTSKGQLNIASIHGPPGVGKTIIAGQVYTELKPEFDLTAWVTVSTNPNIQDILRSILRQISPEDPGPIEEKNIIQAIIEALEDKRYFLVIDNICEIQQWDAIKCALTRKKIKCTLPEDYNGSAVLTTTCCANIAGHVGGGHKLETLNARRLFDSFTHLHPNTRSCLLYLSLFQKGYEISVDRLIWGWIAEGFINERDGMASQEKGEEYLIKLMEEKFIEVLEVDVVGKALSCRLHDRMHEVLVACSAQQYFATIVDGQQGSSMQRSYFRRLSIQGNTISPLLKEDSLSHTESLVVSGDGNLLPSLSNFTGLRVFELGGCDSLHDLRGIGSLRRLRCLVMGSNFFSKIPKEIGNLVLLQTLDLRATNLIELPQSVFQISQLRRLCVNSRTMIPDGIGKMENLEELGDINITKPELLKKLCNLTKLRVLTIAVWSSDEIYGNKLLKYLCSLLKKPQNEKKAIQSLSILTCCSVHFWDKSYNRHTPIDLSLPKLVIRHSKFHSLPKWICSIENLSSLSIEVYKVSQDIIGMLGKLQHLESLSLTSASKRSADPEGKFGKSHGAFSKITSFRIVSNAMGVIFEQEAMPNLRRFTLSFEASRTKNVSPDFDFGLKYLPSSLEHVRAEIICSGASPRMVEQAEAVIQKTVEGRIGFPKVIVENQRILDKHMVKEDEVEQIAKDSPDESSISAPPETCVRPNAKKTDEVRSQITQLMIDDIHHQLKLLNHDAKVKDILRDTGMNKDEAHQLVQEARDRVNDMMKQVLEAECGPSDKSAIVERLYNLGKYNGQHKKHLSTGENVSHGEGPGAADPHPTSHHSTTVIQTLSGKGLSITPGLCTSKMHTAANSSEVTDPAPGHAISETRRYRDMHVPQKLMECFLRVAEANTKMNLETCGILSGTQNTQTCHVTTLIIPKQKSTSDTCEATDVTELWEAQTKASLSTLGTIHTHPTQTCFMSSVDLHNHHSYQAQLPEAIAIVMAPTDTRKKHGVFHLTDLVGMDVINNCPERGFHTHGDDPPIYEDCSHVYMNPDTKFDMIDLRER